VEERVDAMVSWLPIQEEREMTPDEIRLIE